MQKIWDLILPLQYVNGVILCESVKLSKLRFLISKNGNNTGNVVNKNKNLGKLDIGLNIESATTNCVNMNKLLSLSMTQYSCL